MRLSDIGLDIEHAMNIQADVGFDFDKRELYIYTHDQITKEDIESMMEYLDPLDYMIEYEEGTGLLITCYCIKIWVETG